MSDSEKPEPIAWGWTLPQRRAIVVLLSIFLAALGLQFAFNSHFVPDPQVRGDRSSELASRLDPNLVDWQALATIPNLGEKRAKDIISYRDRVRANDPRKIAFKTIYDLRVIRGIGPATLARLRPYLTFPGEAPSSGPAPSEEDEATR